MERRMTRDFHDAVRQLLEAHNTAMAWPTFGRIPASATRQGRRAYSDWTARDLYLGTSI